MLDHNFWKAFSQLCLSVWYFLFSFSVTKCIKKVHLFPFLPSFIANQSGRTLRSSLANRRRGALACWIILPRSTVSPGSSLQKEKKFSYQPLLPIVISLILITIILLLIAYFVYRRKFSKNV